MSLVEELVAQLRRGAPAPSPAALRRALALLLRGGARAAPEAHDHALLDLLIADCDRRLGAQLDAILHHPQVRALEANWRALARLIDRVDFDESILIELLSCTKQELYDDFSAAPEIPRAGLYQRVYAQAFGVYGGRPYGILCAAYDFGPGAEDLGLLRYCAAVAAIAHAPLLADASPALLGLDSFAALPRLSDPAAALAGPRMRLWQALRDAEDARYVGLCLPRVLLREPYDVDADPSMPLRYREHAPGHQDMLWGPAAMEMVAIAAASFARHRWCVYVLGSRAAAVASQLRADPPTLRGLWRRLPLEAQMTNRIERALADEGLIPLVFERSTGRACALSAPSVRRPRRLFEAEGDAAAVSERLGAQLPYVFLICRLAHYLKCVQRERVGSWLDRSALERELDLWLRGYVSDQDDAQWEVRARRPFRRAAVRVEVVEGQAGWYRCHLELQPHLTHNSAAFTLSLVGRLDRPNSESRG
ncbi:MAG: type VI secretion system contractile sheath large subunit [Nannocystis sp.]|nr:type VI secretion system contractile sheath large subunit [Nannocystis sp.]